MVWWSVSLGGFRARSRGPPDCSGGASVCYDFDMTRSEAISTVESKLKTLSDERLELLAEVIQGWSLPTAWSSLSAQERAKTDAAIDSLDQGLGIPLDDLDAEIEALLTYGQ
jgi:hypothetical protein